MKLVLLILFLFVSAICQPFSTFYSTVVPDTDYSHAESIKELALGEKWGWNSGKIGDLVGEQSAAHTKANHLFDLDVTTAMLFSGIGDSISFRIVHNLDKPNNFNGILEIFNGYCNSEKVWREYGRVSIFSLLYNGRTICTIGLADTWQYQSVNLQSLFRSNLFPSGHISLRTGDVLTFKIAKIFPGAKYREIGISELVTPSYGGG